MIKACSNRNITTEVKDSFHMLEKEKKSQMSKIKKAFNRNKKIKDNKKNKSNGEEISMYDDLEIVMSKTFDEYD